MQHVYVHLSLLDCVYETLYLLLPVEPCSRAPHLKSALPLVASSYLQTIGY